jgi:hypothetical protein
MTSRRVGSNATISRSRISISTGVGADMRLILKLAYGRDATLCCGNPVKTLFSRL